MRKMLAVFVLLLLKANLFADEWQLQSVFASYDLPVSNGYGIHGTVVAPDGNIWVAMNGNLAQDSIPHTFTAVDGSDSAGYMMLKPIHVYTPAGAHASYSPIRYIGTEGTSTFDTLTYSGKGMCLDHEGNILYSTNELYRFNYMTGEMMHRVAVPYGEDEAGNPLLSSLTYPSVDQNGNIYLGWVGGADKPIVRISPDFATQTVVAETGVNYNRSALISPDASRLYLGSTWNGAGVTVLEANALGTAYTRVDTLGNEMGLATDADGNTLVAADGSDSMETKHLWVECLFWNHGVLWAGETNPAWSSHSLSGRWVGLNPTTGEVVDQIGTPQPIDAESDLPALAAAGGTNQPRSMGRTPDGLTLYLGDYGINAIQVWTNADPTTVSIDEETEAPIIASGYALYQAYPNPFNPSTTIQYEVGSIGNTKIEIFNIKGELVNTLVDAWHYLGSHEVVWNGRDHRDIQVPSGTYIYKLTSSGVSFSKTVTLLK